MRARQTALAQALAVAAAGATWLGAAASLWSPWLSEFQAEADALERQAADVQANRQYLAAKVPAVPALKGDLAQSETALSAIRAKAEQLHREYLSTAASIMNEFDLTAWWDSTEDIRKYPERRNSCSRPPNSGKRPARMWTRGMRSPHAGWARQPTGSRPCAARPPRWGSWASSATPPT
ncbi:MAG TPA: hypothetical protein VG142_01755 [Trebonia sp.]|nr:hypothetical protein [Trebonia sp.]